MTHTNKTIGGDYLINISIIEGGGNESKQKRIIVSLNSLEEPAKSISYNSIKLFRWVLFSALTFNGVGSY